MRNSKIRENVLAGLFVALIIVGAFIQIPIPVVPFTLQFLFTTLAGLLLGAKLGSISVIVYLILGLVGVPVFTKGGGLWYLFEPTFGYLIGFAVGAFVTGYISNKVENPSYKRLFAATFAGLGVVYLFGLIYLYCMINFYLVGNRENVSPIALKSVFIYGFVFAVPGDILICIVSSIVAKRVLPILKKQN